MRRCVSFAIAFLPALASPLLGCGPTSAVPDGGAERDACSACGTPDAVPGAQADANTTPAADANTTPAADANTGTPTGSYVYYIGDFETADVFQVARMDLGNNAREILNLVGFAGGTDITGIAISPNNAVIAVAGQDGASDSPKLELYAADGSGTPTLLYSGADSSRTISTPVFSPDGSWLAFRSDSELLGSLALHVVPADGSAAAKRISLAPVSSSQDVATFTWSKDSQHIAFVGDLVSSNVEALWTVNATASSPVVTEIVTTAELGDRDVGQGVDFDSSNRLYFRSDHELGDNQFRLYRAAVDGSARTQVSGTGLGNGAGEAAVGNFRISPDGAKLAFASDSPTANLYQVFVLDLSTSAPALVSALSTSAPPSGLRGPNFFEPMEWSPDGSMLTMAADWPVGGDSDNDFSVFVLPSSGVPGGVRLARPEVGNGDATLPSFASDSSRILFRGDMLNSNHSELFGTANLGATDQAAAAIRIEEAPLAGAVEGFALTR